MAQPNPYRVLFGPIGNEKAILGQQGKNIVISNLGEVIAVIYGAPTTDPGNPLQIVVAYSFDNGLTWTDYAWNSPELAVINAGADGSPDFHANPGELYFVWQETPAGQTTGPIKVMVEGDIPSNSWLSYPIALPSSASYECCLPCIGVDPDNPYTVLVTAQSRLHDALYSWISHDGGYTWTDPIVIAAVDSARGKAGHFRRDSGGHVFMTYHDSMTVDDVSIEYPYYVESTDGGYTWLQPHPLPVPYVHTDNSLFWWHEMDCDIIASSIWAVHTDLGADSMWLFRGMGSPGSWSWTVYNITEIASCSTWTGSTLNYAYPVQYASIGGDPGGDVVVVSYKGYYYYGDTLGSSTHDGAHIGAVLGMTYQYNIQWNRNYAASVANNNEIAWDDWGATEMAHRLLWPGMCPD
jgi:hypothetical protein